MYSPNALNFKLPLAVILARKINAPDTRSWRRKYNCAMTVLDRLYLFQRIWNRCRQFIFFRFPISSHPFMNAYGFRELFLRQASQNSRSP
jgi:hypothetical protein